MRTRQDNAAKTQIVVLTCRPAEYLLAGELTNDAPYRDSADNLIRAANLQHLVSGS